MDLLNDTWPTTMDFVSDASLPVEKEGHCNSADKLYYLLPVPA